MARSTRDFIGWVNYEKLAAKAEKIRREDPSLTQEQAMALAYEQNPTIAKRYHEEARGDLNHGSTTR